MQTFLDLLVTAVGIGTLAQYTWSMRAHFHSPRMPDGAKIISAVVIAAGLFFTVVLWTRVQPVAALLLGLALQLCSLALFWSAIRASRRARLRFAFDADNPDSLVTEGPYRYVRHPFYSSYILFWIGWGIASWSVWALVPVVGIIVIYVVAARDEEAKFARTELSAAYAAYRQRTGLFWPLPSTLFGPRGD